MVKVIIFHTKTLFAAITLKFIQRGLSLDEFVQKAQMELQTV